MSKVMGIYVNFWHFYDVRCPNMAMSRNPRSKFRKNFIFPDSAFNIGKVTEFLVEKLSTLEVISQKPHGGRKHPPVLLGLSSIYRMRSTLKLISS